MRGWLHFRWANAYGFVYHSKSRFTLFILSFLCYEIIEYIQIKNKIKQRK